MSAIYNFCAGPAMLPQAVMQQAQKELLDWNEQGVSVMEISHRSKEFIALAEQSQADIRRLMAIPDDYHVLFMHGGGRGQFAAVVNNFLGNEGKALYLVDGSWSSAAAVEAIKLVGEARIDTLDIVTNDGDTKHVELPNLRLIKQDYRYVHYCPNETVDGIEIFDELDSPWPIVADMSSNIMSREIDVSRYGLIYAGAQKNIGPSGISIVIVKDELLRHPSLPQASIMDYRLAVKHDSMLNTPPTFAWYLAAQVFKWLETNGGVASMAKINQQKAAILYDFIDASDFYVNRIAKNNRSQMNVTFYLENEGFNEAFLVGAKQAGLLALKGHRSVGGMRASIYNAMPQQGIDALLRFMDAFAKKSSNDKA